MKTFIISSIAMAFALCACQTETKPTVAKVTFGVYQVINRQEIPTALLDTLKTTSIQFETDSLSGIVGYVQKADTASFALDFSDQNVKLFLTRNPVDKENLYYALAVTRLQPELDQSDISKTQNEGSNVMINFTQKGATKWADLTKKSIGKMVAFVIDNRICSMPYVNSEIRNGAAMIAGFESDTTATRISEALLFSSSK